VSVYQLFKTLTKDEKVFDSYANRKARDDTATSCTSVSKLKSRKYCKGYLSLGLKSVCIGGKEQPKCLIRHKTLSVDSKKPSKLKQHLESSHTDKPTNLVSILFANTMKLSCKKASLVKYSSVPSQAFLISYKLSYKMHDSVEKI
jgi:hypothetical protein